MNNQIEIKNNQIVVPKDVVEQLKKYEEIRLEADMFGKELRNNILEIMEQNGIQESFEINGLKVVYRKPSTRTSLDSTKLKKEQPNIYDKYSKTSDVKSSVSLEFLW